MFSFSCLRIVRLVVLTRSIETLTCVMWKRAAAVLEVVVGSSRSVATTSLCVGKAVFVSR